MMDFSALTDLSRWGRTEMGIAVLVASAATALVCRKLTVKATQRWLMTRKLVLPTFDVQRYFQPLLLPFFFLLALSFFSVGLSLPDKWALIFDKSLHVGLISTGTWFCLRSNQLVRQVLFHLFDTNRDDNIRQRKAQTQILYVSRTVGVLLGFLGFCLILMSFDGARRIGESLATSAGLVGLVAGFAAQRTLANVAAGFSIAFTQPIRLDDVVVVEKEWGRIEEITLTYVVVRIWDLRRLVLPITYFVEKPFENWTRDGSKILGQVMLYLDHRTPIDKLRSELQQVLHASARWDGDVGILQVTDTTERTIQVRILVSAMNSSVCFDLRCDVREALVTFLRDHYPESLPRTRVGEELVAPEDTQPFLPAGHAAAAAELPA